MCILVSGMFVLIVFVDVDNNLGYLGGAAIVYMILFVVVFISNLHFFF